MHLRRCRLVVSFASLLILALVSGGCRGARKSLGGPVSPGTGSGGTVTVSTPTLQQLVGAYGGTHSLTALSESNSPLAITVSGDLAAGGTLTLRSTSTEVTLAGTATSGGRINLTGTARVIQGNESVNLTFTLVGTIGVAANGQIVGTGTLQTSRNEFGAWSITRGATTAS